MNKFGLLIGLLVGWSIAVSAYGQDTPPWEVEEPLPPDAAFQLDVVPAGDGFVADWHIAEGYYLYRHKIKLESGAKSVSKQLPAGETHHDEFFGESQIFRKRLAVPFRVAGVQADDQLQVTYQGCADLGVCYPPIQRVLAVRDIGMPTGNSAQSTNGVMPADNTAQSTQERIAEQVGNRGIVMTVLAFLGFGLLLAFTPCILPMIPILSGIIVGSGGQIGSRRALALSSAYVLAMATSYAVAGVAIGLTGANLQAWLQTPWIIGTFALLFVLLALSMFGLYELKMPSALQNRLNRVGAAQAGSVTGAVIMGAVSMLIVGACVTPPLIGALLFIAQKGDALTGGLALFSLGLGMGIPLLLIGTSLGKWLPQPGPAWDLSKVIFGILLLAVAIWMLDRIVSLTVVQYLSAILLVMSAVYFWQAPKPPWLWRGIASVLMIYGILLMIAAATGGGSFIKPLEHLGVQRVYAEGVVFQPVQGLAGLEQQQARAVNERRMMMLDFYADWCVSCKEMEAWTFSKAEVTQALSGFITLQTDVTENNDDDQAMMQAFGIFGPPAILFFDRQGNEIAGTRLVGYVDADAFVRHVARVKSLAATSL